MRPPRLEILRHGKWICQKVFPAFVDTFNYAVRAIDNLRGDWDINPKNGSITVDRSDAEHPVIRLRDSSFALKLRGGEDSNISIGKSANGYTTIDVYYI